MTKNPPQGFDPYGGFISEISENPTSFPYLRMVELGWKDHFLILGLELNNPLTNRIAPYPVNPITLLV